MPTTRRATAGASLEALLAMAVPLLREAQGQCPRTGPGRTPLYDDWKIAALILCGVLKKKKGKSASYRFARQHRDRLLPSLGLDRLPARSTYCQRYGRVWPLVQAAVRLQGRRAVREHACDAEAVAADKSLVDAPGPAWHARDRAANVVPAGLRGVDRQAAWGWSAYRGWVHGYSFEVVVTAPAATSGEAAFPLLASVDVASASEQRTCRAKLAALPPSTRFVLTDGGYDGDDVADAVERPRGPPQPRGRRAGRRRRRRRRRRFLCPPRDGEVGAYVQKGARERRRRRRIGRHAFLRSRRGRTLYARRKQTVEPFNGRFKQMFELEDHTWHRGLDNNRTQILTAVFCYQLLVRYHRKHNGGRDAQVQYLLDGL